MTPLVFGAFAAGMVATVNPCGFAMLPAYLALFMGEQGARRRSAAVVGFSVSLGFVIVFLVAGLIVASGVRVVIQWIPWLALLVGVSLVVVGIAELRGHHLYARIPGVKKKSDGGSITGLVGFGASYGVASLSCTLPIFLSLIAGVVAGTTFFESLLVFMAYGAGMSLVVVVLTLGLAVGRDRIAKRIRPLAAHLGTISGWILILAGVFIVWYWFTVLSSGAADLAANPVVGLIDRVTAGFAGVVSANPLLSGIGLLLIGVAAWWWVRKGGQGVTDSEETQQAEST